MNKTGFLTAMVISEILIIVLYLMIKKQKKSQLKSIFNAFLITIFIWTTSLLMQLLYSNTPIDPFFFEKFAAIGAFNINVVILLLGLNFSNSKLKFNWKYSLLFVIPIISIIMAFTNDYHHLFVKQYSIYSQETVWGPYFTVHTLYSYICIFIGVIYLLKYIFKNAGFFSKQSIFICLGILCPLVVNILGTSNIINAVVYLTPISFTATILCFSLAIFKFDFLKITPIAMQRIVDSISDSFIVLNENGVIIDFNQTLLKTFKLTAEDVRNKSFAEFTSSKDFKSLNKKLSKTVYTKCQKSSKSILIGHETKIKDKYFNIEVSGIFSKNNFLGILILFKDVTQHIDDMESLKNNQDLLIEQERLASLGQMIGGIAHNLKTPIFSVSGGLEGLSDLIKEYDESIDDDSVTNQDMHDIAKDMNEWIVKLKEHMSYMSDVITTVKGQAVNMSESQRILFPISELFQHVNILMQHELKEKLAELVIHNDVPDSTNFEGNINSLVQVVDNLISNSIEAYGDRTDKKVELFAKTNSNNLIISVKDYGPGLPESVQNKLFKEMITTKGKNGTGLGLFMSYSNIKAHFNGTITFETEENKGTTFNIIIPIK